MSSTSNVLVLSLYPDNETVDFNEVIGQFEREGSNVYVVYLTDETAGQAIELAELPVVSKNADDQSAKTHKLFIAPGNLGEFVSQAVLEIEAFISSNTHRVDSILTISPDGISGYIDAPAAQDIAALVCQRALAYGTEIDLSHIEYMEPHINGQHLARPLLESSSALSGVESVTLDR